MEGKAGLIDLSVVGGFLTLMSAKLCPNVIPCCYIDTNVNLSQFNHSLMYDGISRHTLNSNQLHKNTCLAPVPPTLVAKIQINNISLNCVLLSESLCLTFVFVYGRQSRLVQHT